MTRLFCIVNYIHQNSCLYMVIFLTEIVLNVSMGFYCLEVVYCIRSFLLQNSMYNLLNKSEHVSLLAAVCIGT